ncbi:MAG: helicase C-terminal domain-containing protein, partial [Bdellovibrionota bacterium]
IVSMINAQFKNPKMVSIQKKTVSNADIEKTYYVIREKHHKEALCRIFDMTPDIYGIIFCRTRLETRDLANELTLRGHKIEVLHGEMSQKERDFAMAQFKAKKTTIMVCTDVAARGIDVNNLTHVINYGLPQELDSYVHRIGRTGRAGMKGIAISLVDSRDMYSIRRLEKMLGVIIKRKDLPSVADLKAIKVLHEIENMGPIFTALQDKKGDFKTDETFDLFKTYFEHLSKEEALKILFTWTFNKELKRLTDVGPLQEARIEERPRYSSRPQSGGGRSRHSRGDSYHHHRRH